MLPGNLASTSQFLQSPESECDTRTAQRAMEPNPCCSSNRINRGVHPTQKNPVDRCRSSFAVVCLWPGWSFRQPQRRSGGEGNFRRRRFSCAILAPAGEEGKGATEREAAKPISRPRIRQQETRVVRRWCKNATLLLVRWNQHRITNSGSRFFHDNALEDDARKGSRIVTAPRCCLLLKLLTLTLAQGAQSSLLRCICPVALGVRVAVSIHT